MENWLSGLGFWQKRENLENRDFHDLGHVEDAFRRKIDVGSVLVCRRGILERMPSLQAGRAETVVDGLPRACRWLVETATQNAGKQYFTHRRQIAKPNGR